MTFDGHFFRGFAQYLLCTGGTEVALPVPVPRVPVPAVPRVPVPVAGTKAATATGLLLGRLLFTAVVVAGGLLL